MNYAPAGFITVKGLSMDFNSLKISKNVSDSKRSFQVMQNSCLTMKLWLTEATEFSLSVNKSAWRRISVGKLFL